MIRISMLRHMMQRKIMTIFASLREIDWEDCSWRYLPRLLIFDIATKSPDLQNLTENKEVSQISPQKAPHYNCLLIFEIGTK